MKQKGMRGSVMLEMVIAIGVGLAVVLVIALMQIQQGHIRRTSDLANALSHSVQTEVHRLRSLPLAWYYVGNTTTVQTSPLVLYRPLAVSTGAKVTDDSRQTRYYAKLTIDVTETSPGVRAPLQVTIHGEVRFLVGMLSETGNAERLMVASDTSFTSMTSNRFDLSQITETVTFIAL